MNEKFYEALEVCLQDIETGADIETVLQRYPLMADDLRPILETSLRAQSLAATSVPEDAMRRGRTRVLQHAAHMRESASSSRQSGFAFPRLAVTLALTLIFILSGTGLVRASNGALPGDNLYPVKRTWEDMRLLLVFNPEVRDELEDEFEQERVDEVDELLVEGRHETIAFTGLVTEQKEDMWLVSDIPVKITPDGKLPIDPVTVGASVMVEGNTNIQGYVEAERIELLQPSISLPPFESVEIENSEELNLQDDPSVEENTENELEKESLLEDYEDSNDDDSNNNDFDEDDAAVNSNDDKNDDANDNDNSNDDNSNDDEPDEPDDD